MEESSTVVSHGNASEKNMESVSREDASESSMMMSRMSENDETMREEDDTAEIKAAAVPNKERLEISVGGTIDTPALCLLDGIQEIDDESGISNSKRSTRKTLPIRLLPAVLGRGHPNHEKNFVDMGKAKALSRQHVRIEYRVALASGRCGQLCSKVNANKDDGKDNDLFYFNAEEPIKAKEIIKSNDNVVLPSTGFYVITCLGKNRIIVNGKRIEQGQTAHIKSGDAIRISSFCLYFLTPTKGYHNNMQVRDDDDDVPGSSPPPQKKRRIISLADKVSSAIPSVAGSGLAGTSSAIAKRNKTMQTEIDAMSTNQLLRQMSAAMENQIWDRRHQLIGSTISQRAVLAAARDLIKTSSNTAEDGNNNELSRGEIMDWIADSDRFGEWREQMLTKMEAKSFQTSITKALQKAGFTRTATTGRYIKWNVPDLGEESEKDDDDDSDDSGDNGGSVDDDDADEKSEKEAVAGSGNEQSSDDGDNEKVNER